MNKTNIVGLYCIMDNSSPELYMAIEYIEDTYLKSDMKYERILNGCSQESGSRIKTHILLETLRRKINII